MTTFVSRKGLFGHKVVSTSEVDSYKKPNKNMLGKVYEIKATERGLSVFRNGQLVAEGLESLNHREEYSFFVGKKGPESICFDKINEREIPLIYGDVYFPTFMIATDGSVYSTKDGKVSKSPRPAKAVVVDGDVYINGGLHLVEGEGEKFSLSDRYGEIVLSNFTADRTARFDYTKTDYGSKIDSYYTVVEAGRKRLFSEQTQEVIYETSADHTVKHFDGANKKFTIIADYDESKNTTLVSYITEKGKVAQTFTIAGKVQHASRIDSKTKEPVIAHYKNKGGDLEYITLDGRDVSDRIKAQVNKEWNDFKKQEAEREFAEETRRREEFNELADHHEKANIMMGASLMGLGMPATGSTVIATTMISRAKRKAAERAEQSNNDNSQPNDEPEWGDE